MSILDKEEFVLDVRNVPEIEQKAKNNKKRDYGNKYMIGRKNLNIRDEHIKQLDAIRKKIGCRSYDNVIEHLCDLEAKVDPILVLRHRCKTCDEKVDVPKNINTNKFVHSDLCTTTDCKGYITHKVEIATGDDGTVYSKRDHKIEDVENAKDKERLKDEQSKQTDTTEEKEKVLDGVNTFDDNSHDIGEWSQEKRSLWADGKI